MPSATVLADQGVKAVAAGKYKEGIEKLTEALKEKPAPLWLLERSKAYVRTGDIDRALHDAERALRVAFDRANRDMMIEAQIRRAVTYFRLKRYADADVCAFWAIRLCEGARASEDDGQTARVGGNGDYAVTLEEVKAANARTASTAQDGLSAAMGGGSGRTKETQWKNEAFTWRLQALTKLEQLPPGDPGRKVGVTEKYPNPPEELPDKKTEEKPAAMETSEDEDDTPAEKSAGQVAPAPKTSDEASKKQAWEKLWNEFRTLHAKNDIRSSYYQTDTTLSVDLFVKNVPKDEFKVDTQTDSVTLGPIPNTHTGQVQLFLYDKIKPEETKHTVKSMKIELVLKKETPGKWPTLRKQNSEVVDNLALASSPATSFSHFYNFITGLGYESPEELQLKGLGSDETGWYDDLLEKLRTGLKSPTATKDKAAPSMSEIASSANAATQSSSDAMQVDSPPKPTAAAAPLADDINKPKSAMAASSGPAYPTSSKKGPKNWDKIDDEDDAEDGGGDVNSFFQTIYKNADDDTRRAMMKSYIESNGTSLSTSWAEAKDKKYETLPPDGSEAKKW
ncbi:hypothetical protein DL769_003286 [Monosporascus sp. CRB-8-3]|nr:hypothetical protein DL769_003286 [Monosporascus sp. CRB-8-3]